MDVNNFLQSEATQFVGTAAANTIGLVIGTIHKDIKELLEIPDEYQAISIVSSRTGTVAQAIAIDDAVKAVNAKDVYKRQPHSHTQTVMDLTNMPVYLHPESGFHTLALLLKNVTVLYNQGQSALFLLLKAL